MTTRVNPRMIRRVLLRVGLTHEYWNGPYLDYTLAPLPRTAEVLRRLGLSFRADETGMALHQDFVHASRPATPAALAQLADAMLCWEIRPTAIAEFAHVTQPSFSPQTQCLVLKTTALGLPDGRLTTKPAASVADLYEQRAVRLDVDLTGCKSDESEWYALQRDDGGTPRQWLAASAGRIAVDTSADGSAPYRLVQDGRTLARWFGDERALSNPTGVMLALPGGLLAARLTLDEDGFHAEQPPTLSAHFTARKIAWRYHVANATGPIEIRPDGEFAEATADTQYPRGAQPWFREVTPSPFDGMRTFEARTAWRMRSDPPERFVLIVDSIPRPVPLPLPAPAANPNAYADVFFRL